MAVISCSAPVYASNDKLIVVPYAEITIATASKRISMLSSADQVSDTARAPAAMRSAALAPERDGLADMTGLGHDNTVLRRRKDPDRQVACNIVVKATIDYYAFLWWPLSRKTSAMLRAKPGP